MRWSPLFPLLVALTPAIASAWPLNGARLTAAPWEQQGPELVGDGAGGAFVSWADFRDYGSGGSSGLGIETYLQHVTAAGYIAPGWPADGLLVGTGPWGQSPRALRLDGSGGVLVVYADTRFDFGDLYLQRITATGAVAPGWPAAGVAIAVGPGQQYLPEIANDGAGGAFVSWQDGNDPSTTRARYTHVLGSAQLAPGWPVDGRLFEPAAVFVLRPLMLSTATGGFLACWSVSNDTLKSVRMLGQRFTSDGIADPAWPTSGVTVCQQRSFHRVPRARLVDDATGGFYTVIDDYRSGEELFVQHVLGSGAIAAGWPADALPVSTVPGGPAQYPSLCEDGQGGVFVAWEDYRSNYARVFGQHFTPDGQPHAGWPASGLSLSDAYAFQLSPQLAWDGIRGMYLTWMNLESGGYRSYVKHLTANGAPVRGWSPSGLPVVPIPTDQYVPKITADGLGGAIVTWEDIRNGESDVYAQRFVNDGVVAAQVSLVSAEATPSEVRLRWQVSGESRANVERREGEGEWAVRAQLDADGGGFMNHVDREVTAGVRYGYRLAFAGGVRGGETSIAVPAAYTLSLEGATTSPSGGSIAMAFTLPDAAPARLDLFDITGRRLASHDVGSRGAGRHVARLDEGPVAPGIYWATLTRGSTTLRAKAAVLR